MEKRRRLRFLLNEWVDLGYHACILFSESFPDDYANGSLAVLNSTAYV
jgi:hypothetical protein